MSSSPRSLWQEWTRMEQIGPLSLNTVHSRDYTTLIVTWYWAPFNKRYPYTAFQISNVTALLLIHYLEIKNNY